MNKVLHGDCLELMKELRDQSIDMVITSPPYDNLRSYENSLEWNENIWQEVIQQIYRVLKDGSVCVWVVGDATVNGSETGTSFKQALFAKEIGFNIHDTMIYEKDNPPPVGGSNRYYQSFEYMFVFSKKKISIFNPIKRNRRNKWKDNRTKRVKAFNRDKNGIFKKKEVSLIGDVKIGNIWKYIVGGGNSVEYGIQHPATFPLKLANDHIISWSNEGDLVLDPFAGSGTTAIACLNTKRNYVLMEKEQKYFDIINERIDSHKKKNLALLLE